MELTVLVDNDTFIDEYYLGEPGVCYYLEDGEQKILMDVGYSDICIRNAEALHKNMTEVSTICLSHGHDDHTRGLKFLHQHGLLQGKTIVTHPYTLDEKQYKGENIGAPFSKEELETLTSLLLSREPVRISEHLIFLGEIPESNTFEKKKIIGKTRIAGIMQEDYVREDSALVYQGREGLTIITGCSHSGICNITEYAKKVCKDKRIAGIIGGFHLLTVSEQLGNTITYFKRNGIRNLYPCHCVSFEAKAEIHKVIPIHPVGVGMHLSID